MKNKKRCNDSSCQREVIGVNGNLIVVNHFSCETVINQINRAKNIK